MSATSRRRRERLTGQDPKPRSRYMRPAFLAIVLGIAALIGVAMMLGGGGASADSLPTASNNMKGSANAPVEIENWSDFQCPACKMFAETIEKQLAQTLIPEGQVRLVFRQMAFMGDESVQAASASECAAEQGQFWPYHDRLFAEQKARNSGAFSKANLKRYGAELGLEAASFYGCVDNNLAVARILSEGQIAKQKGVQKTPTLFVNGRKIEGVPTWEMMQQAISSATVMVPVPSGRGL